MSFQEKILERSTELRSRAAALAENAVDRGRVRIQHIAKTFPKLNASLSALKIAGGELKRIGRRHASRFATENSALAADVGRDVSTLARSMYSTLVAPAPAKRRGRKVSAPRSRKVGAAR